MEEHDEISLIEVCRKDGLLCITKGFILSANPCATNCALACCSGVPTFFSAFANMPPIILALCGKASFLMTFQEFLDLSPSISFLFATMKSLDWFRGLEGTRFRLSIDLPVSCVRPHR